MDIDRVRYPRQFEIYRLEALGDVPYFEIDEARQRYEEGKGLSIVSDGRPPSWFIQVSPKRYRFSVTLYAATGTPVREVTWEQHGGELLCRRTIDLFYPDGDPGGRVPLDSLVTVTQQISADGVVGATLSSPMDVDDFREATGVPLDAFRLAVPPFGEWQSILTASAPAALHRFGIDSIDAAIAYLERCVAGAPTEGAGNEPGDAGWRVPAGPRDIMSALDGVLEGVATRDDIPVLVRGSARILPLAVQADPLSGSRDSGEEHRRMSVLAAGIRDACEHREGQAIAFDLDYRGADRVASYASALRSVSASKADWWAFGQTHGVALVSTGDAAAGNLALALHVVPVSWVSERQTKVRIEGIDLGWSWSDVANWLELHA